MKKKFFWLLLLIVPAFFIAAALPETNTDGDETGDCSTSGTKQQPYNGNQGCPYTYDFSDFISCTLYDVDLDNTTPAIEHHLITQTAEVWYVGDGKVELIPQPGYGNPGFIYTLNVRVYFDNGNTNENEWWTCEITQGTPPYPPPCY